MSTSIDIEHLNDELKAKKPLRTIVLVVVIVLIVNAAEELNGFGHLLPGLDTARWALVSAMAGAVSLAIFYPKHWYVGLIPGALMGVMVFFAVYYYTRNKDRVHSGEVVLVGAVASIPAALVYYQMLKRAVLARSRTGLS